ncbi:hypothetical protein GCM10010978_20810 [Compostibacillus humi]|jgi:uncharacterized protein YaaR (DUF327 family)|uniref:DUF327 family protein n=1 Tax=Compostibacillus humi TaxID=1245525 RepID=A0A8J2TP62_9BACI|nr:YaaR family protein [Compostibacillus humi]GFZ79216.1 hypothetical protein GCM10010978_20810 [Compostibacillus humi]HLT55444.1 YaaR family protein [Bacillota bacterium]
MKITSDLQTKTETAFQRKANHPKAFQQALASQVHQAKQQELEKMVKNITVQGDKLARSRTFRDLAKFKRLIKEFLQVAVAGGYQLEKNHSFGMYGSRKMAIVKEVDEKLLELTEQVMDEEKKTVEILGLIGEIKGLLINLYT